MNVTAIEEWNELYLDPEPIIDPHDCNEEVYSDSPYAKRCYSGYSKPVEEQMATICQCMVEEEVI